MIKIPKIKTRQLFIILFGVFALWSFQLPGITIPQIGTLFPLRIFVCIFGIYFLLCKTKKAIYMKTEIIFLLFLGIGLFSFLWTIDIKESLTAFLIYITNIFTLFTTFVIIKDNKDLALLAKIITINAIIIGIIGIYESVTGNYYWLTVSNYENPWVVNALGWKYPHSIFFNTNDFAVFMVAMLPVYCLATEELKNKLIIRYILLSLSLFCVFLTGSRLCLLLCIAYFVWLLPKKDIKGYIFSFAIILLSTLFIYYNWSKVSSNILAIISTSLKDEDRIQIWLNCIVNIIRSNLIGYGIGNTILANQNYTYVGTNGIFAAHNYFLEIFLEFGIIGFLLFTSWIISIIKKIYYNFKYNYLYSNYLLSFLVLYVFLSTCSSSIRQNYYLWVILGLCVFNIFNKENNRNEKINKVKEQNK